MYFLSSDYFGIELTLIAYFWWFIIRPISIFLNKILKELGQILCQSFTHILRYIIPMILLVGSIFGIYFAISEDFINGFIMIIGLGVLAIIVHKTYLKAPLPCPKINDFNDIEEEDISFF